MKTNEEWAKKIAQDTAVYCYSDAYNSALKMAEWKDEQSKEYLEKKRDIFLSRAEELYDSTDTMAFAYNNARLKLMDEIINELFNNE